MQASGARTDPERTSTHPAPSTVIRAQLRVQPHQRHGCAEGREHRRQRPEQRPARPQCRVMPLTKMRVLVGQDGVELARPERGEQTAGDHDPVVAPADAEGVRRLVLDHQGATHDVASGRLGRARQRERRAPGDQKPKPGRHTMRPEQPLKQRHTEECRQGADG